MPAVLIIRSQVPTIIFSTRADDMSRFRSFPRMSLALYIEAVILGLSRVTIL